MANGRLAECYNCYIVPALLLAANSENIHFMARPVVAVRMLLSYHERPPDADNGQKSRTGREKESERVKERGERKSDACRYAVYCCKAVTIEICHR